jgi:hypothetical protein
MPDRKKRKIAQFPQAGAHIAPTSVPPSSTEDEHITLSLRYLSEDRHFRLSDCDQPQQAALSNKIHRMTKRTWREARNGGRHGAGYEIIERRNLRAPIPPHITEDVTLIAFRFCGLAVMIGYRDSRTPVFYVVWLDPKFKLYDHD